MQSDCAQVQVRVVRGRPPVPRPNQQNGNAKKEARSSSQALVNFGAHAINCCFCSCSTRLLNPSECSENFGGEWITQGVEGIPMALTGAESRGTIKQNKKPSTHHCVSQAIMLSRDVVKDVPIVPKTSNKHSLAGKRYFDSFLSQTSKFSHS